MAIVASELAFQSTLCQVRREEEETQEPLQKSVRQVFPFSVSSSKSSTVLQGPTLGPSPTHSWNRGSVGEPSMWPLMCDPRPMVPVVLPHDAQHRASHLDCAQEVLASCHFFKAISRGGRGRSFKDNKRFKWKKKWSPSLIENKILGKRKGKKGHVVTKWKARTQCGSGCLHQPSTSSQHDSLWPAEVAQTMQFDCKTNSFSGRDIENLGHVVSIDGWKFVPWGIWSLHPTPGLLTCRRRTSMPSWDWGPPDGFTSFLLASLNL